MTVSSSASESSIAPFGRQDYYPALDITRGIAAATVVLYHVCRPLHIDLVPRAYLAVDFFFLLSGFVIAHAYDDRLCQGMSLAAFLRRRAARLYPLFALGMAMGIAVSGAKLLLGGARLSLPDFAAAAIMGLALLPFGKLPYNGQDFSFPFNGPAWSLFFEAAVNLLYGAALCRWSTRLLAAVSVLAAIMLEAAILRHGSVDMGGQLRTFPGGAARVCFSFTAGVALFRLEERGRLPRLRTGAALGALLLAIVLAMPAFRPGNDWYDSVAVGLVFPAVLILCLGPSPSARARRWARSAGALSYPVYITHFPIMRIFQFIAERRPLGSLTLTAFILVELTAIAAFAYVAARMFDGPVQRRLRSLIPTRGSPPKSRGEPALREGGQKR